MKAVLEALTAHYFISEAGHSFHFSLAFSTVMFSCLLSCGEDHWTLFVCHLCIFIMCPFLFLEIYTCIHTWVSSYSVSHSQKRTVAPLTPRDSALISYLTASSEHIGGNFPSYLAAPSDKMQRTVKEETQQTKGMLFVTLNVK